MTDEEKKKDQIDKTIEDQKNPMEQKNKKSDPLEDKSLEELHKQIEKGKRKASRSIVFAIAAIIAIIAIGVAWFVSNTKVSAIGAKISADNPVSFELGSTGSRSPAESDKLKDPSLSKGTSKKYNKYIDVNTGDETNGPIDLYCGSSNLAWYLNSSTNIWPGASGKLEFYIIPKQDNLTSVTVTVELAAYKDKENSSSTVAEKIIENETKLNGLLSGHILLFRGLDDTKGYSKWIEVPDSGNPSFKIEASEFQNAGATTDSQSNSASGSFTKDMPYKVTLYWIWPKYFRNYIYGSRNTYGDLFTDVSDKNADYTELLKFVNNSSNKDKLFYGAKDSDDPSSIKADMEDTVFNTWSSYYDLADEYIGNNVKYVFVNVTVN